MPLSLTQRQTAITSAASASLTATYSPAPTTGALLIACGATESPLTMTSAGWTLAASAVNSVGLFQWWKIAGASESTSVIVTPSSSSEMALMIAEWSGNDPAPLDKTATAAAQGSTTTPVSGTTAAISQPDELAVAMFGVAFGGATGPYTAYTNGYASVASLLGGGASPVRLGVAELALNVASTTTTTATGDLSANHSGLVVTYRAAPTDQFIPIAAYVRGIGPFE